MSEFGENVARERERLEWSQGELARRAGIARGTVYNCEVGKDISAKKARAIADALGKDVGWLFSAHPRKGRK